MARTYGGAPAERDGHEPLVSAISAHRADFLHRSGFPPRERPGSTSRSGNRIALSDGAQLLRGATIVDVPCATATRRRRTLPSSSGPVMFSMSMRTTASRLVIEMI